jgi:2-oxoglutarate dehydrogenase E2 component (dihydrolipoamide succinyltransferase)
MNTTQDHITVVLPSLGENVTEATITRWLKVPGERVESEEPLLEVSTDKVDTEIPSPMGGFLLETLVPEDTLVNIGDALAVLSSEPDRGDAPSDESGTPAPAQPLLQPAGVEESFPANVHIASSPETLKPYGGDRVEKLTRIRQTIARRMVESLHVSAQLTTVVEVDVTTIARMRAKEKQAFQDRSGVKLSFLPFFVASAVEALRDNPVVNASLNADCTEVTYRGSVHLGMAVDSEKGLMVPVIRDADSLGIVQLAKQIAECADQVRSGNIRPDSLSGGTFTITNTGSRGALFDTPIINQPQSAILGIGSVVERVVPTRDMDGSLKIEVRSMAYISLSYDHRLVDGADAARYLGSVRKRLEAGFDPSELQ